MISFFIFSASSLPRAIICAASFLALFIISRCWDRSFSASWRDRSALSISKRTFSALASNASTIGFHAAFHKMRRRTIKVIMVQSRSPGSTFSNPSFKKSICLLLLFHFFLFGRSHTLLRRLLNCQHEGYDKSKKGKTFDQCCRDNHRCP